MCCSWAFWLVLWAAGCLGHLNCANCALLCANAVQAQRRLQSRGLRGRFFEKASLLVWGFFCVCVWKTLSWRGATAAPLSEGPVNDFYQVTSCYPKVQGQLGGGRALPSACRVLVSTGSCSSLWLTRARSFFAGTASVRVSWWG